MRRAPSVLAVLVAVGILAVGAPAWAHGLSRAATVTPPPPALTETLVAAVPAPGIPLAALVLLAALALGAVSRHRRVIAVTLVLGVMLLVCETGAHSTHHLGKPADAAQCAVASMSAHLSADTVETSSAALPAPAPDASTLTLAVPALAACVVAPDAGRAPPALSV
ncbi:MAG: hypothetical protein HY216_13200 [Candidatus Rokubacteria bacterium]|nr:hypothetical protein [Candidatus Rokubacteria bacterium]